MYIHIYIYTYIHTYLAGWLAEYVKNIYIFPYAERYEKEEEEKARLSKIFLPHILHSKVVSVFCISSSSTESTVLENRSMYVRAK